MAKEKKEDAECSLSFAELEDLNLEYFDLVDDVLASVAQAGNRFEVEEPENYLEAINSRQAENWKEMMKEE